MGIVAWPRGIALGSHARCALCGRNANINTMAIGMTAINGTQAFACNGHFWDKDQFIMGWADCMAEARFSPLGVYGS